MILCDNCRSEYDKVKSINPELLIKKICDYLKIPVGWVISNNRKRELCEARHIICDMLYHNLQCTQVEIGQLLGGRDHSTVVNSIRQIKDWCFDTTFREHYIKLHKEIYGHTMFFMYNDEFYETYKKKNKNHRFYITRIN